jgi:endonuclease-8
MPEGDSLARMADLLRPALAGRIVSAAWARTPGPRVSLIFGQRVTDVIATGKHLRIQFANGLELRTHLRMHGTWHRYRPGEPWRRPAARAVLVLEVPGAVAVCFDAPVVDLFETRAAALHPALGALGPNLVDPAFDADEALRRLRLPERANLEIGPALLDQRALAGIGNVFKSEVLFIDRVGPFRHVADLDDETLGRLVATARRLLVRNADPRVSGQRQTTRDPRTDAPLAAGALWVYGRSGRPCRRCGTPIRSAPQGTDLPRTTYWCPSCQEMSQG